MRVSKRLKKIDLSQNMDRLSAYFCDNQKIMAAFLFGSYGMECQTPLSDVDFGILTRNPLSMEEELEIMADLTELLEEDDVNVVFLNKSDLVIQYQVLATGRLLHCKDQVFLADFIEQVTIRYCDFRIDFELFNKDYDQGLREEFLDGR